MRYSTVVQKRTWLLCLFFIVLLGAILRFWNLGEWPVALNRDEASIAYNAYSLWETGRDEHGVAWPINVESFGDWKLGGYIYTVLPLIAMFGLQEWVVRLPAAMAGVLLIPLIAVLTKEVWEMDRPKVVEKVSAEGISLWAALLLALSPWAVRLSRQAYEANLGLLWIMLGAWLLIRVFHRPQRARFELPLSVLFWSLSIFTYHSYQGFLPIFFLGTLVFFRHQVQELWRKQRRSFVIAGIIGVGLATIWLTSGSQGANGVKISGLSVFGPESYQNEMIVRRAYFADSNSLMAKVYANRYLLMGRSLLRNVSAILSGGFLWYEGGNHGSHDVPDMGNVYPTVVLAAIAGALVLAKRWFAVSKFLLLWVIAALLAPMVTLQAAHSVRLLALVIPITVAAAIGIEYLRQEVKERQVWVAPVFSLTVGILLLVHSYLAFTTYFIVSPQRDIDNWHWVMKPAVEAVTQVASEPAVFIPHPEHSFYIYALFYNQVDPTILSSQLEYYPVDAEGFRYAKRLGNLRFESVSWQKFVEGKEHITAFVRSSEIPADVHQSGRLRVIQVFSYPHATQEFNLIRNY